MADSSSTCLERKGKFLLIKRAQDSTWPGLWEFPAGKIELGERPEDAARREVLEETGITVASLRFLGTSEREKTVYLFHSADFSGEVRLSEEHTEYKWLAKKEILEMEKKKLVGMDTVRLLEKL